MGKRILIVEDEPLVRALIEDMVEELGHTVADSVDGLGAALAAVKQGGFDVAILDVMLGKAKGHPIAALLRTLGRPFIVATGFNHSMLDGDFIGAPVVTKPFIAEDLRLALDGLPPSPGA